MLGRGGGNGGLHGVEDVQSLLCGWAGSGEECGEGDVSACGIQVEASVLAPIGRKPKQIVLATDCDLALSGSAPRSPMPRQPVTYPPSLIRTHVAQYWGLPGDVQIQ